MSLSAREIARVVAELAPLVGGAIQRTWAPEPRTAVLRIRVPGHTHLLLVSAEADLSRLHLVDSRPRGEAASFQQALRAELEGLLVQGIHAPPGERMVLLECASPERRRTLVAELTGRHGNLFLLDEDGRVLHSAVPNLSTRRDNVRGQVYEPPRPRARPEAGQVRFASTGDAPFSFNRMVAAAYGPRAEASRLEARRREVRGPVVTALARVDRTLGKVEAEAARADSGAQWLRLGEVLKSELHRVKRGMTAIEVTDWYDPDTPQVTVPLAPELGPQENLARLFRRHRKAEATRDRAAQRLEELRQERARHEKLLAEIDAADDLEALEGLAARAARRGLVKQAPPRVREKQVRLPYRRFLSRQGTPILVGRGARDNHALTFQVAKGNDVWLHVRDHTGSHVVVPTGGRGEVDEGDLLDAAHLAAHFSDARGEPVVEITFTQRKHLRHPPGAPPGLVTHAAARTLTLRVEPERLARLLSGEARA